MIDWSALVADSALNLPKNEAKAPCSDPTSRNKPQNPETVGTAETRAGTGFDVLCSDVPTCPTVFERPRVSQDEKHNPPSFKEPGGDGVEGQPAPHKQAFEPSCKTCAHLCRPGLSDGLCGGGRDDLPPAFTKEHPLRRLPADGGKNCPAWGLLELLTGPPWAFPSGYGEPRKLCS